MFAVFGLRCENKNRSSYGIYMPASIKAKKDENPFADQQQTLQLLNQAKQQLQEQLGHIEFNEKMRDSAINTIALIVRTLDKIDSLARVLLNDKKEAEEQISVENFDKLKERVKNLIQKAIDEQLAISTKTSGS
jgi:hypothetical protein